MKLPAAALGISALLIAASAQASTIGYWRFESEPDPNAPFPDNSFGADFLVDSGPNGLDLTNPTVSNPTFVNPAGDAGQSPNSLVPGFSNPIPLTGEANDRHAFTLNPDQYLFHPADPLLPKDDFTVEAMVEFGVDAVGNNKNADIASQWGGGTDNVWRFLKNGGNTLSMGLHGNGFGFFNANGFTFDALDEYYVAAVVDIEPNDATTVTFYAQNLTDGTPLMMFPGVIVAADIPGPVHQLSTAEFRIGGNNLAADGSGGLGATRIDEVRLSSGLLAESELLINPPAGDFDLDGDVDVADALLGQRLGEDLTAGSAWNTNFGSGSSPVSGAVAASVVPEPTSATILLCVASVMGAARVPR